MNLATLSNQEEPRVLAYVKEMIDYMFYLGLEPYWEVMTPEQQHFLGRALKMAVPFFYKDGDSPRIMAITMLGAVISAWKLNQAKMVRH